MSVGTQMRLFDGHPVEQFGVRFGSYDLEDEDVSSFRDGDVLVLILVTTVEGATIKPIANGDRKRINNLKVHNMRVVKGEMRENIVEIFHLSNGEDQLALDMPLPTSTRPGRDVDQTGELGDLPTSQQELNAQDVDEPEGEFDDDEEDLERELAVSDSSQRELKDRDLDELNTSGVDLEDYSSDSQQELNAQETPPRAAQSPAAAGNGYVGNAAHDKALAGFLSEGT